MKVSVSFYSSMITQKYYHAIVPKTKSATMVEIREPYLETGG